MDNTSDHHNLMLEFIKIFDHKAGNLRILPGLRQFLVSMK